MTQTCKSRGFRHIALKFLLILGWTLMAAVLALTAVSVCLVRTLRPQVLTPLLRNVAQGALNADVYLERAELGFRPAYPILEVRLDSLTVISRSLDSLTPQQRAALPQYSDTLLTLGSFRGALDVAQLLRGTIAVHDVELVRPAVNIVLGPDGTSNFDIYHSAPDTAATEPVVIPAFTIDHFRFVEPRSIRYFNAPDSTEATVLLLADAALDGTGAPEYSVRLDGRLHSPVARTLLQLPDVHFGLDGRVHWNPATPTLVSMDNFTIEGAFLRGAVSAVVDMGQRLTVSDASFSTEPMLLTDIVRLLPEDTRRGFGLDSLHFGGNAAIGIRGRLTRPFCAETDTIPYAEVSVSIEPSDIVYNGHRFRNFALEAAAVLEGNNPDSATVSLSRFSIAGPATDLNIEGLATNLVSDPYFEVCLRGRMNLAHLPRKVLQAARGYISGQLNVDVDARGKLSMLSTEGFHRLYATGNAVGSRLYYLSEDTSKMVTVNRAEFVFGTHNRIPDAADGTRTLSGRLSVDSVNMLMGGVDIAAGGLRLGVGMENARHGTDTTQIVPVGGGIRLDRLRVISITDSAGMRLRGLAGRLVLRRFKGDSHVPELELTSRIERLSGGSRLARIVLNGAELNTTAYMRPERVARNRELRRLSDSIHRAMPELAPDSVYALALEKRRRRRGPRRRHVELTQGNADNEILEWNLNKGFRKFLVEWRLRGTLATRRARLFTPFFPIHNRFSRLDLSFTNDSIVLGGLAYKAGHSDLAVQGIISDIRKALVGRPGANSLKVNLDIQSDTVDVNQLAATVFAGASFADRFRRGEAAGLSADRDEDELARDIEALADTSHTAAAVLIPINVDAQIDVRAANILYSDLHMTDFDGRLLMYDGALNLNHLRASSPAGDLNLSALYSAPRASDIKFGMGLQLSDFNIERFLNLIPAVDSIMPLMRDFSGTVNADIAATVDIDSMMNMELPTLDAAMSLSGDNLAFIDADTYRTIGKWLRFRDKADNKIKHMSVQLLVKDNRMQIFPFTFDIDRYRLCVAGYNDLALNFDYHIAVLKSPLPFKFGVTVKGNPDKYKVRLGGAKYREGAAAEQIAMVDTTRVNLINEIENVFRRGVSRSRFARLNTGSLENAGTIRLGEEQLSAADSLLLERQGMTPGQLDSITAAEAPPAELPANKKRKKK